MARVIVPANIENITFDNLLREKVNLSKTISKLKELVEKEKTFEEESMLYQYKGKDKDEIWSCMEFFYKNLWTKEFREFIYTDPKDNWENYHIQLKYKEKYSEVTIVYGIGSFCVIGPQKEVPNKKSKILDLDKIVIKTNTEILYNE